MLAAATTSVCTVVLQAGRQQRKKEQRTGERDTQTKLNGSTMSTRMVSV